MNSKAENFAVDAFNRVNLYLTAVASYSIGNLPGQFSPSLDWSNQRKIDLENPFGPLTSVSQAKQAVGGLLGANSFDGLPANFKSNSWFAIANVSQYLFVKDDLSVVAEKLKSGQVINGVGVFVRGGYDPEGTNTVARDFSAALFAHGLFDNRIYDSFGIGFYYNVTSNDFKNSIRNLTLGQSKADDEKGIELFYDFAITPAIRIIPGYQHIWNPLTAQVSKGNNHAEVFLARLTAAW